MSGTDRITIASVHALNITTTDGQLAPDYMCALHPIDTDRSPDEIDFGWENVGLAAELVSGVVRVPGWVASGEPHCHGCGHRQDAPRRCPRCQRGNLELHSFCGYCGCSLLRSSGSPSAITNLDGWLSEEITLSRPIQLNSQELTLLPANDETDTREEKAFQMVFEELASTHSEGIPAPTLANTISENRGELGMCVVLLGDASAVEPLAIFPLQLGEPLDVDGPELIRPGTFTATPAGLRLDARGGLRDIYARLDGHHRAVQGRRLRHEPSLGTFQAISLGEVVPYGSFAFIDDALIRVDPV